ncbi:MAG: FAD-dependent oxidoreductase [Lachnospiraceae bacterium]|nr:FAD-dependent oxidoreductase [Lachnospiraceae bacterium]
MDMRGNDPTNKGRYDVIVVGGGIAGVAAAVSSARAGAKTLLIEKCVNLGGLATTGLISWYEPLCDGQGKQMIGGIAEELIKLSVEYGLDSLPERWGGNRPDRKENERYATHFSPTIFSVALDDYVLKSGAQLRFDTWATYPVMDGSKCLGVVTESVNGREFFEAGAVVDASGDASVMDRAGVPCVLGKNYMSYIAHYYDTADAQKLMETKDTRVFRKWMGVGSDMEGNGHPEGMKLFDEATAEELTRFMVVGKQKLLERIKQKGKNNFDITTLPYMPQFRTIRRIVGKCDFPAIDGMTCEDSIGWCGDFRPKGIGKHYQLPFGALYSEGFDNLIAAGRIISAPQGDGWEVSRVIPVCALTGEAAGRAAAISALKGATMDEVRERYMEQVRVQAE